MLASGQDEDHRTRRRDEILAIIQVTSDALIGQVGPRNFGGAVVGLP